MRMDEREKDRRRGCGREKAGDDETERKRREGRRIMG